MRYYPGIHLEGLKKTTKNLRTFSVPPETETRKSPKHKTELLPLEPTCVNAVECEVLGWHSSDNTVPWLTDISKYAFTIQEERKIQRWSDVCQKHGKRKDNFYWGDLCDTELHMNYFKANTPTAISM
jgi:hypothetical protein